jgi:hypothetical protein
MRITVLHRQNPKPAIFMIEESALLTSKILARVQNVTNHVSMKIKAMENQSIVY